MLVGRPCKLNGPVTFVREGNEALLSSRLPCVIKTRSFSRICLYLRLLPIWQMSIGLLGSRHQSRVLLYKSSQKCLVIFDSTETFQISSGYSPSWAGTLSLSCPLSEEERHRSRDHWLCQDSTRGPHWPCWLPDLRPCSRVAR